MISGLNENLIPITEENAANYVYIVTELLVLILILIYDRERVIIDDVIMYSRIENTSCTISGVTAYMSVFVDYFTPGRQKNT